MPTQTAKYALRAAVTLARQSDSLSTADLARQTGVPPRYLAKVLQELHRSGLVTAQRGKYGGYRLARSAGEISVLDVVNATSPLLRIERCPLGKLAHAVTLCPLHRQLDDAVALLERKLSHSTLADLIDPAPPVAESAAEHT